MTQSELLKSIEGKDPQEQVAMILLVMVSKMTELKKCVNTLVEISKVLVDNENRIAETLTTLNDKISEGVVKVA